jgi:ATP diphosphatase
LHGVGLALPALTRALKLQARAARVGFDWPDTGPVLDKIAEEIGELKTAMTDAANPQHVAEEYGDLLFVLVNFARHLAIDPEAALRAANAKFERRFSAIEARLRDLGKRPEASTLAEMDALWNEIKQAE